MRISRKKRPQKALVLPYSRNEAIMADRLLVLDPQGNNLGEMSKRQALDLALEKEFDLVEINPKSNPPVAKLVNFAEFKYQKEKEMRKQKAHSRVSETKGIRLSIRIGKGDLENKGKQAEKFLNRGDKVKLELMLRGRENAKPELAVDVLNNFIGLVKQNIEIRVEQEISKQGNKFIAIIGKA